MHVVSLDPSLTATGLVSLVIEPIVSEHATPVTWKVDTLRSKVVPGGEGGMMRRIEGIVAVLDDHLHALPKADLYMIEGPAYSKNVGMAHERAGLWWHIYYRLYMCNIPILVVKPNLRAKYATGKGNAGKDEVLLAVNRRYPECLITNNNEADAAAMAAMGADLMGFAPAPVPASHRTALKTLVLPPPRLSPGRVPRSATA